jgi:hypothetical protein
MKLRVERRGGLVGKLAIGERYLKDLSSGEREALDKLLKSPPKPGASPGADRFRYKVQVLGDGVQQELEVPEDAMPEELASIAKLSP